MRRSIPVRGSRVAVVGGSIAGCATAIALARSGCEVTVFEPRGAELGDRGFGIGMPTATMRTLVDAGYLDPGMRTLVGRARLWVVSDGSRAGRVAWHQPMAAHYCNWGLVWRGLRRRVPEDVRWLTARVDGVQPSAGGVLVHAAGRSVSYDVVAGADGYRSIVRDQIGAGRPQYAGYSLWRGSFPEARLPSTPAELRDTGVTVMLDGGHGVFYRIPAFDHGFLINWCVYEVLPWPRRDQLTSLPPGSIDDAQTEHVFRAAHEHMPPAWSGVVSRTHRRELALQPIYDLAPPRFAAARMLLVGDAGALARPHIGAGVAKAIEDALALETLCREHGDWGTVLAAYDRQRTDHGRRLVEFGRRLGGAQVGTTPPWQEMTADDYAAWWSGLV